MATKPSPGTSFNTSHPLVSGGYLNGVIPFNEGSGAPYVYNTGGSQVATVAGSPTWLGDTSGALGGPTVYLPGSANYDFGTSYGQLGNNGTIVIWFYTSSSTASLMLGGNSCWGQSGWYIMLNYNATGAMCFVTKDSYWYSAGSAFALSAWNCLVISSALGSTPEVYINGSSVSLTASGLAQTLNNTSVSLMLGDNPYHYQGTPYIDSIGWAEFWTVAMNSTQAAERYDTPFSIYLSGENTVVPSDLLTFAGMGTTWTSGSSVSITDIIGTLDVTAGTWTCVSNTVATLGVVGTGTGTFTVTIDEAVSPTITVISGSVSTSSGSCLLMES